jgi:Fur family transcriptional regulator, ferric uptake regulator
MNPVTVTATATSDWIERAEATLTAAGHRRGGARRALLELLDAQECALSAQEIEDALRARGAERSESAEGPVGAVGAANAGARGANAAGKGVSRASVYRILDELERLRLVQRVETGQTMVRYERVNEHAEHHHHLVCDECGVVMPFSDPGLERAIATLSERVPMDVSEHEIVLHGACRDCAAA